MVTNEQKENLQKQKAKEYFYVTAALSFLSQSLMNHIYIYLLKLPRSLRMRKAAQFGRKDILDKREWENIFLFEYN